MRISTAGAAEVNFPSGGNVKLFDFSTPSGWTMFYWTMSVVIILLLFLMM